MTGTDGARSEPLPQLSLPTIVPVAPLPTNFRVVPISGAAPMVHVALQTPAGITTAFIDPEYADRLAHALRNAATRARSGLVLPNEDGTV